MKTLTNIKTWSTRAKNATAALLFLAAYTISMVAPFVPVRAASAAQGSSHEVVCHRLGNGSSNAIPPDQQSSHIPGHVDLSNLSHSDYIVYAVYPDDTNWNDLKDTLDAKCISEDPAPPKNVTAPTYVDACGTVDDTYTIPTDPYATYKVNNVTKAAGTYASVGSVSIVAIPKAYTFTYYGQTYTWDYELIPPTSWTFTFSDAPCTGSITIRKDAIPNNSQDFSFATTGTGLENFNLDDDSDATLPSTRTFSDLSPGQYAISESATGGWDFDNISCSGSGVTKNGTTVTINLAAGANVSCTYTNRQHGKIIVNKVTDPANDTTSFPINISPATGVAGTVARSLTTANPVTYEVSQLNTYSVSEDLSTMPDWTTTGNTCTNLTINGNTPLVNGVPTLSCTINNAKLAKLTIVKDADPNDQQDFAFITSGSGLNDFSLDDDSDATLENTKVFNNLALGQTYTVTESSLTGWKLNKLVCEGGATVSPTASGVISFIPTAGQDSTCTYTNVKLATISGVKWNDIDGLGSKDAGEPTLDGWVVNLVGTDINKQAVALSYTTGSGINGNTGKDTGAFDFGYLMPGTYTLTETNQTNWTQTYAPISGTFTLLPGQNLTNQNFGNQAHGKITIKKKVVAPQGYTDSGTFDLLLSGTVKAEDVGDGGSTGAMDVVAGSYNVSETAGTAATNLANYTTTYSCNNDMSGSSTTISGIVIAAGSNVTCTFTNTHKTGTLTIKKVVVNDNGGLAGETDFSYKLDNAAVANSAHHFETGGTTYTLPVNTSFSVTEATPLPDGYKMTGSSGCSGTVTVAAQTCTITNDDNIPSLSLKKIVSNHYNGPAVADDWKLTATNTNTKASPASISGAGGAISGDSFDAGTYALTETPADIYSDSTDNYTASAWKCDGKILEGNMVSVALGQSVSCEITNSDTPASIIGTKYIVNADESLAGSQTEAKDWTIQLYGGTQNGNVIDWTYITSTATASDGTYGFAGLKAGLYKVVEVLKSGWTQIFGGESSFTVGMGETYGDGEGEAKTDFGNFKNGSIGGDKFEDVNRNGERDKGEPKLEGWTIELYDGNDYDSEESEPIATTETTLNGYVFNNLKPGKYVVCEVMTQAQALSWIQTYPDTEEDGCYVVVIDQSGETNNNLDFGNFQLGIVNGYKWNDSNGNAEWDEGEPALAGWNITLTTNKSEQLRTTTDANGKYSFSGLTIGQYIVCEDQKDGWAQTYPMDVTKNKCNVADIQQSGGVYTRNFGNMQLAKLTIVKDVRPDSTKTFSFTTDVAKDELGKDVSFSLTDDGSSLGTNTKKFENVLPGTYTITENQLSGWKLDNIACTGTGVTMTRDGAKLTVTLAAGAVAACTFVNSFIPQVLAETYPLPTLAPTGDNTFAALFMAITMTVVATGLTLYRRRETTI